MIQDEPYIYEVIKYEPNKNKGMRYPGAVFWKMQY